MAAGTVLTAGAALLPDIDRLPLPLAAPAFLRWRDAGAALTVARIR